MTLNEYQRANIRGHFHTNDQIRDSETGEEATSGLDEAAVEALIDAALADLVAGAPGALDTLNELAAALGDDANFATTITDALSALDGRVDDLEEGGPVGYVGWQYLEGSHYGWNASWNGGGGESSYAQRVTIASPMLLRKAAFHLAGSGSLSWSLYDITNPAAAVRVASGSGSMGSTGWQSIAATGAPVLIPAGTYVFVFTFPSSGAAGVSIQQSQPSGMTIAKAGATGATENFTTGWGHDTAAYVVALMGDLGPGATWW